MIQMRCIKPNQSLIPSKIQIGDQCYLDEDISVPGLRLGVFYRDSLKTDYLGVIELDRMEVV